MVEEATQDLFSFPRFPDSPESIVSGRGLRAVLQDLIGLFLISALEFCCQLWLTPCLCLTVGKTATGKNIQAALPTRTNQLSLSVSDEREHSLQVVIRSLLTSSQCPLLHCEGLAWHSYGMGSFSNRSM